MSEAFPNDGPLLAVDDVLLREFIEYLPDDDIRAVVFSRKRLGRVISSPPYSRTIRPPSPEHILSSLALTKWALETQWVWPKQQFTSGGIYIPGACEVAAGGGHLEVLQWAHANGCPWDSETCSEAARGGHLEVLQWARANGCPWDPETCSLAAQGGHLEVLQWVRANGCPWDRGTCSGAARGGHLEVLQWAHANGCPWGTDTCAWAATGGHLEVLQWARANGCPCNPSPNY